MRAARVDDAGELEESIEKLIAQLEHELESVTNEVRPPPVCDSTSNSWNVPGTDMSSTARDHRLHDTTSLLTSPLSSSVAHPVQLPDSDTLSVSGFLRRLNNDSDLPPNLPISDVRSGDLVGDINCMVSSAPPQTSVVDQAAMTSRDCMMTSNDCMMTSRDSAVPFKKAELFPIPRTNLFVFNGNVVTLQNVIEKLHAPVNGTESSHLSESDQNSHENAVTSRGSLLTSRGDLTMSHDIMTKLSDVSNPTKTLEAVAEKLKTVSEDRNGENFPIQIYDDPSEVPTRRSSDLVTSRGSVMTSPDSTMTSSQQHDEYESLNRFLDDLQIIPPDQGGMFEIVFNNRVYLLPACSDVCAYVCESVCVFVP